METKLSKDNTLIAFERTGQGPPLVLVHGTAGSHASWDLVQPFLSKQFTLIAIDRRGRWGSGDAVEYSIDREFEDIAAVMNSFDEPVNLLGHSYGAIIALEAALQSRNLRRLILYEPPVKTNMESFSSPEMVQLLRTNLANGQREQVLITFLQETAGMSAEGIARARTQPAWPYRVAAAHTILREIETVEHLYQFDPTRFRKMATKTSLLEGSDSPANAKAATQAVRAALPNSLIAIMLGQKHLATGTAPELFARIVIDFLHEPN